ncbi:hypothetical protein AWENTII_010943 [Aspergillus wentii]
MSCLSGDTKLSGNHGYINCSHRRCFLIHQQRSKPTPVTLYYFSSFFSLSRLLYPSLQSIKMKATFVILALSALAAAAPVNVNADAEANVALKRGDGKLIDVEAFEHSFNSRDDGLLGLNVLNHSFNSGKGNDDKGDDDKGDDSGSEQPPCGCEEQGSGDDNDDGDDDDKEHDKDGNLIDVNIGNHSFNSGN